MTVLTQELLEAEGGSYREVLREGICDLLAMRAPLHCAARLGKVPQLELLLEAGAPVDCLDGHGWTALQVISQNHTPHKLHPCLACLPVGEAKFAYHLMQDGLLPPGGLSEACLT